MSCDNNCEAIAGLHESAANLIEYEKLIDKWLNGNANEEVVIAGTPTPTLLNLAMSIKQLVGVWPDNITIKICADKKIYVPLKENGGIYTSNQGLYIDLSDFLQAGGGLGIDNQGRWFVNFDQMPTTKFDAILEKFRKGLRLPKWLTTNTNFYVDKNHVNASDTLDEGRGLSASKPFKNIQACVNYVADNFNLSRFNAYINIGEGEYSNWHSLGAYTSSTGIINLIGTWKNGAPATIIKSTNTGCLSVRGNYLLKAIKFHEIFTSAVPNFTNIINIYQNGILTLDGWELQIDYGNNIAASASTRPFAISGELYLSHSYSDGPSKISINGYTQGMDAIFRVGAYARLQMLKGTSAYPNILCSGACSTFISLYNGAFSRNTSLTPTLGFSGSGFIGKRYYVAEGGRCNVGGLGADYFPGNTVGTVDSSTFSWYK